MFNKCKFSVMFLVFLFIGCATPVYYHSTASVPRHSYNCKTIMKKVQFDYFKNAEYTFYNRLGAIIAKDVNNGNEIKYLLFYKKEGAADYISVQGKQIKSAGTESFSFNNMVTLRKKHIQELLSVINESIETLKLKERKHDNVFLEYNVTPDYSMQKAGQNSIDYYPSVSYNFRRSSDKQYAVISFFKNNSVEEGLKRSLIFNYSFQDRLDNNMLNEMRYFYKFLSKCLQSFDTI